MNIYDKMLSELKDYFTIEETKVEGIKPRTKEPIYFSRYIFSQIEHGRNISFSASVPSVYNYLRLDLSTEDRKCIQEQLKSYINDAGCINCMGDGDIKEIKLALEVLDSQMYSLGFIEQIFLLYMIDYYILFVWDNHTKDEVEHYVGEDLANIWEKIYKENEKQPN